MHQEGIWNFDDDDFLLAAILQDPVYAAEVLWEDPANREYGGCYRVRDFQYPLFRTFDNYAGFACARSVGKALADGSPVLTTQGYRPIQTLRVGDLVIGSDGYPTPVLGVYPQGEREVWRVRFSDGAEVDCDDDHLWTVTCDSWQTRGSGPRTLPVRELRTRKARFKVQLPSGPVEFARLPDPDVDPWAVGALIGDGNLSRPTIIRFASVDDENVTRLAAAIGEDAELVHEGGCNYRIRGREAVYAGWGGRQPCNLLRWTRERGLQGKLAHEKRVPHEYLWGSVETRLQVLRGLADTDGSVTHSGSVEISTASEGLAHDIRHLALSLGGRASIRRGPTSHRDRFRVVFRLPSHNPFCLTRKHSAYAKRNRQRSRDCDWRGIKEINRVGHRPATCIEVAAEDGLFMAADMVLTHNTESIKAKAFTHAFRRQRENLLVTAPELIHLLPLTDAIEERIRDTRLTREFLDLRGGQTGFTHRPFGVNYRDGTKIVGRIPRLTGTGVKGQHQPDLLIDEAQDYPERGWVEVHETVMKDDPTFTYHFYGVHSGARDSGFYKRINEGGFKVVQVTAMQRPGWNASEKQAAKAAYGGTSAPDYRRNIIGEAGAAASAFFVTARLVACLDQDRESHYNQMGYVHQELRVEEVDELGVPLAEVMDLPSDYGKVWAGMDVGLTNSPTVISLFSHEKIKMGKEPPRDRLKLIRRYTIERFRSRQIREAMYVIAWHLGDALQGFGVDATGLGFPIFQEMEDDEACPQHLRNVTRGYFFNSKLPVDVEQRFITEDGQGRMRDQYGAAVKTEEDPLTGHRRYVTYQTMIEASTRYLREMVDSQFLLLPFDTEITTDMQGETVQRVTTVARLTGAKKPNAFHILDSFRAAVMPFRGEEVEKALEIEPPSPVLDMLL